MDATHVSTYKGGVDSRRARCCVFGPSAKEEGNDASSQLRLRESSPEEWSAVEVYLVDVGLCHRRRTPLNLLTTVGNYSLCG